ncbi:ThiF family adenylyltransferase [Sedimentitalea sp. JM2-8]|uniref:ThiF family adenylyltransferase n=1 Tax=Sedimentitalea xiamensis TaxID=3050037 RepID=A0ABT7FK77_9RHOB|nr:ThiF family adenylyltransferase [Sedimentitalea xiamensis]MDK3075492.1 ThiF family adenylyltransferase [Sedimentitalea xiamensis]
MSRQLISHNADLKALENEGYEVAVIAGHLVISNVPYVNAQREVKLGHLVSVLQMNGNETIRPTDHKVYFEGDHPCDKDGRALAHIKHSSKRQTLGGGIAVDHMFSAKPKEGYQDYQHKMTTYVEMIASHARAIDPAADARTFVVANSDEPDPVFNYTDTASARAGIGGLSEKLAMNKVAIVGLGGTGSYVLDLIAKTPIRELHLIDGDDFLQHNAFRSPGAPSLETLRERLKKVEYFAAQYAPMRKGMVAHPVYLEDTNAHLLDDMDFVFLCVDSGAAKRPVVERLEARGIPFIDVGMGIQMGDDSLVGVLRVTTSTTEQREPLRRRVGMGDAQIDDAYATNIQVADLNALNAAFAVVRWKKLLTFYADYEGEHSSNYTIDGNTISNMDKFDDD